jgi:hypothetical protein
MMIHPQGICGDEVSFFGVGMDATCSIEMSSFGQTHFGACKLPDKRLTSRLVHTADLMLQHPGGTLPDKLNNNDDLIGFYRLANNPKVTHAQVIASHAEHVRQMIARAAGVVLIIHDTTEFDFSGLESVQGLGQIGHGGCSGLLGHNSLAYDYDAAEVLGLAGQLLHVRRKVPKGETAKAKRDHPDRESRLWKKGWTAVGPTPAGQRRVHVADRGSDMLEFTEGLELAGEKYVIRSKTNRNIEVLDEKGSVAKAKLHDFARALPSLGERAVTVSTNRGHAGRTAQVSVSSAAVKILSPHFARGEHSNNPLATWVICVREIDPPKDESPLEWILLSNVPAPTFAAVGERIDWYACRPIIEEFHKAAKTGCGIEEPQFTTMHALQVTIALLSVVATQLLRLRDLSRRADATTRPATDVVDKDNVIALSAWRHKTVQTEMSIHDFCMALAKLGGHLNRKSDGSPGWLVLWRGWMKLQSIVLGVQISRMKRCV